LETDQSEQLTHCYSVCAKFLRKYTGYIRRELTNDLNALVWEEYNKARSRGLHNDDLIRFVCKRVFLNLKLKAWKTRDIYIPRTTLQRNRLEAFKRTELGDYLGDDGEQVVTKVILKEVIDDCDFDAECLEILRLYLENNRPREIMSILGISRHRYNYLWQQITTRLRNHYV